MLKGIIVENSLANTDILKSVKVVRTWKDGDWILHDVRIKEAQLPSLSSAILTGWYMHFWTPGTNDVIVVYKDKTFRIKYSDKTTWIDAVAYGKSLGIPPEQLDFLIEE